MAISTFNAPDSRWPEDLHTPPLLLFLWTFAFGIESTFVFDGFCYRKRVSETLNWINLVWYCISMHALKYLEFLRMSGIDACEHSFSGFLALIPFNLFFYVWNWNPWLCLNHLGHYIYTFHSSSDYSTALYSLVMLNQDSSRNYWTFPSHIKPPELTGYQHTWVWTDRLAHALNLQSIIGQAHQSSGLFDDVIKHHKSTPLSCFCIFHGFLDPWMDDLA